MSPLPTPPPQTPPKVIIFDIGGVCVLSPMAAIATYERTNNIPAGWINHAISRSAPNGAWHRLERGEVLMDARFFEEFGRDLTHAGRWEQFCATRTQQAGAGERREGMGEATQRIPPTPKIAAESLFWSMMAHSRQPDPYMLPALLALKASKGFVLAALSNTSIFPAGHPYTMPPPDGEVDVKSVFDIFISSAHVGMRKPERGIYELAQRWVGEEYAARFPARVSGDAGLEAGDVVFLDDIGENLKMGRTLGWRTIKVGLEGSREAVRELEGITGMRLLVGDEEKAKL